MQARTLPVVLCCLLAVALACGEGADDPSADAPAESVSGAAEVPGSESATQGRAPASREESRGIEYVLLISIDTLRADYLGCYGHPYLKSPNIDAVAAEGLRFTNHISAAPTTLASHTSMMTGLYPNSHGVGKNSFMVPDDITTLAEILKAQGFQTAAILGAAALQSSVNFTQGFDFVEEDFERSEVRQGKLRGQRRADQVTDAVLHWLDDAAPGRKFIFAHYFDVHWSYKPPEPYGRLYREDDLELSGTIRDIKDTRQALRSGEPDAEERADVLRRLYAAEVTYTDEHIGRLLDSLRERGMWDETLVIITSDHGETMWEHSDYFSHGLGVFDTTIRTPLIIRFPDDAQAGRTVEGIVSSVDLLPSLLEWLEIDAPEGVEGFSFASLRDGDSPRRATPVYSEATHPFGKQFESHPQWINMNKRASARTANDKVVHDPVEQRWEHYDLRSDPEEQNPLPLEGEEAKLLAAALEEWRLSSSPIYTCRQSDSETLRQLEALGYVEGDDSVACNQAEPEP